MKKSMILFLIVLSVFGLMGCNRAEIPVIPADEQEVAEAAHVEENKESTDINDYVVYEDGRQFLMLPSGEGRIHVSENEVDLLDKIDLQLLKEAEQKIRQDTAYYTGDPHFYFETDSEGYLCLRTEIIVHTGEYNEDVECGDHEHKFFTERISK